MIREFVPWWRRQPSLKTLGGTDADGDGDADKLAVAFSTKLALHENADNKKDLTPTKNAATFGAESLFTKEEQLLMTTIPYPLIPRTILQSGNSHINNNHHQRIWCGLLDLLLAYTYDHIMTTGDPTVESAWTISILSPSLSWLDAPDTVHEACIAFIRRSLCYPYWRSVAFSVHYVMESTLRLMEAGIPSIVKALLQMRIILEKSESFYLGNKLFVDPYLYWVQQQSDKSTGLLLLQQELRDFLKQDNGIIRQSLGLEELTKFEIFVKQQQQEVATEAESLAESVEESSDDASSDSDEDSGGESNGEEDKSDDKICESKVRILLDDLVGDEAEDTESTKPIPDLFRVLS